jgi:CubicO group peptidase (beta-lactamase class C family)
MIMRPMQSVVIFALFMLASPVWSAGPLPSTGKKVPAFEPVDKAITEFMDTIGCTAATVAISKNGKLLYSRGFGWSDEAKHKPTSPDALMRLASVTKPITATVTKAAIRAKLITPETKAFDYLAIKAPAGKTPEPELAQITIENLLDHKGGWDRASSFDPMFRSKQIAEELSLKDPVKPANVLEFMLDKPLQLKPGQKYAYSNFGYCVLGRVIEKASKKSYGEAVQQVICKPLGIKDIKPANSDPQKRDPREVWYPAEADEMPMELLDSVGGLIGSAPALCQFMDAYWLGGDQRLAGSSGEWIAFGSLPGTTSMVHQRKDGINVAVLMNGRRNDQFSKDNELLKKNLEEATKGSTVK